MFLILTAILFYVFSCLILVLAISANLCEGAKGGKGARNMVNRRNKQRPKGGGGRAHQGNGEAAAEGDIKLKII